VKSQRGRFLGDNPRKEKKAPGFHYPSYSWKSRKEVGEEVRTKDEGDYLGSLKMLPLMEEGTLARRAAPNAYAST